MTLPYPKLELLRLNSTMLSRAAPRCPSRALIEGIEGCCPALRERRRHQLFPCWVWAAFRRLARHHRGLDTSWFGPCARQRPGSPPRIRLPASVHPTLPSRAVSPLSPSLAALTISATRPQRNRRVHPVRAPPWGAVRANAYASRAYYTRQWSTTTLASCVVLCCVALCVV
jgi:hypothetical protein